MRERDEATEDEEISQWKQPANRYTLQSTVTNSTGSTPAPPDEHHHHHPAPPLLHLTRSWPGTETDLPKSRLLRT